jgi:putative flippase GtrA
VRALWARFGHLVHELGKFGIVGITAYATDLAIYLVLYDTFGWFWAKVASTVIATTVAFLGNRFWTWRHRERSGLRREYLLYFFFNAVGLGIALGCLWASHSGLGYFWPGIFHTKLADTIAAQGVGLVAGTIFRFWSYKRFVFVAASSDAGSSDAAHPDAARPAGEPVTQP